jgi:hypothetical protein
LLHDLRMELVGLSLSTPQPASMRSSRLVSGDVRRAEVGATVSYDATSSDVRFASAPGTSQIHRPTGRRIEAAKMCLYTVAGGAIVREEVSYFDPPASGALGGAAPA